MLKEKRMVFLKLGYLVILIEMGVGDVFIV